MGAEKIGWGKRHPDRRIRLHLPTAADERRLAVPPYGLSYFELVRRACHGDKTAENLLAERYLPRLNRWARGRLPRGARAAMA